VLSWFYNWAACGSPAIRYPARQRCQQVALASPLAEALAIVHNLPTTSQSFRTIVMQVSQTFIRLSSSAYESGSFHRSLVSVWLSMRHLF
jgi:hypothetical protein